MKITTSVELEIHVSKLEYRGRCFLCIFLFSLLTIHTASIMP
jgi:hypothetical protein